MQHQAGMSFSDDRSGNADELEGAYEFFWGRYRTWTFAGDRLQLRAGGMMNAGAGFVYNTLNGNNPAQARIHVNIMPSVAATWRFSLLQRQMAVGENHLRPHLIHLNRCRNILLDGFRIRESPFWTIHVYLCDNGIARNLDVRAHGHNNDGIDLEMTRNFLVEDCTFDQGDDAVVIKAGRNRDAWRLNAPCENIVVRNCHIIKGHTLLGIGSEISGGIRNVYMHHCAVDDAVLRVFFIKTNHRRGGFIENIFMEDVRVGNALRMLEIDTDVLYQWKDLVPTYETAVTRIENIRMNRVECDTTRAMIDLKGDATTTHTPYRRAESPCQGCNGVHRAHRAYRRPPHRKYRLRPTD